MYSDILDGGTGRLRCQVVVVDGPDRGRACRLGEAEVEIGTGPACGLVLSDDRVSARHLAVRSDASRFAVRDLGSTNGTWYEGSRITEVRSRDPGLGLVQGCPREATFGGRELPVTDCWHPEIANFLSGAEVRCFLDKYRAVEFAGTSGGLVLDPR